MPHARCVFDFFAELTLSPERSEAPLLRASIEDDLVDLVDDALVSALLADELPTLEDADLVDLEIALAPVWHRRPIADGIQVSISRDGAEPIRRTFRSGRWLRRARARAWALSEERALADDTRLWVRLVAEDHRRERTVELPGLQAPPIRPRTLQELGVRRLGDEPVVADHPVLVNRRAVDQILAETEAAGLTETGGGFLGQLVRLDAPLPGASSRVVTVLSAAIPDARHTGDVGRVTFDPDALADAARVATLRGLGERVVTAYHSHGWGTRCGRCNRSDDCAIPSASYVSHDDYRVLESLFPSKATVLPIAGRRLGAPGDRPVLEIHAWREGRMEPISWRTYHE